ncbi:hypothetical protein [Niabella soli]|uniref:hypothetical protein n=1 Tax=Niabella soli TaxID=446683 RepID=UPI0002499B0D|nr:hypothetical protein [Niabella soli]
MKLSPLLAQYLLTHKELSLPGLGTFHAEAYGGPETATVTFEQQPVSKFDERVVAYISEETGKMKVLAASDLESQLEDAMQFLNTGKPYLFAGIGTLLKKSGGIYEFVANTQTEPPKKKDIPFTERNTVPQSYIEEKADNSKPKRPAVFILIALVVVAIAASVWFYSKTTTHKEPQQVADTTNQAGTSQPEAEKPADDTSGKKSAPTQTTVAAASQATATAPGMITYILETTKEPRASKRYNQLKKIDWPVELEKTDSLHYNILMKLNTPIVDTARVRDSLTVISGKKVTIRH